MLAWTEMVTAKSVYSIRVKLDVTVVDNVEWGSIPVLAEVVLSNTQLSCCAAALTLIIKADMRPLLIRPYPQVTTPLQLQQLFGCWWQPIAGTVCVGRQDRGCDETWGVSGYFTYKAVNHSNMFMCLWRTCCSMVLCWAQHQLESEQGSGESVCLCVHSLTADPSAGTQPAALSHINMEANQSCSCRNLKSPQNLKLHCCSPPPSSVNMVSGLFFDNITDSSWQLENWTASLQ